MKMKDGSFQKPVNKNDSAVSQLSDASSAAMAADADTKRAGGDAFAKQGFDLEDALRNDFGNAHSRVIHAGEGGLLDEEDELLNWHRRAAAAEAAQKNAFLHTTATDALSPAEGKLSHTASLDNSPLTHTGSLDNSPMMQPR